jgi:hypothetical protein
MKFPIGSKIKAVDADHRISNGVVYTVREENIYGFLLLKEKPEDTVGFHPHRFVLVDDLTSKTDQELADEYRRLRRETYPIVDELERRGFSFTNIKTKATYHGSIKPEDISIHKTVTNKIEL